MDLQNSGFFGQGTRIIGSDCRIIDWLFFDVLLLFLFLVGTQAAHDIIVKL